MALFPVHNMNQVVVKSSLSNYTFLFELHFNADCKNKIYKLHKKALIEKITQYHTTLPLYYYSKTNHERDS